MAEQTNNQLETKILIIENETVANANSKVRVAGILRDIKDSSPRLVNGKIPSEYLPDVDNEYEEFDSLAAFPETGVADVLYLAKDTGIIYFWNGTTYQTRVLSKSDVGLSNVNNTTDADKPVSTAQQEALNLKVDKVEGSSLMTTEQANKLAGLENYNDTALSNRVTTLENAAGEGVASYSESHSGRGPEYASLYHEDVSWTGMILRDEIAQLQYKINDGEYITPVFPVNFPAGTKVNYNIVLVNSQNDLTSFTLFFTKI